MNNDPFYSNFFSEEDKKALRKQTFWPVVAALHHKLGVSVYNFYEDPQEQSSGPPAVHCGFEMCDMRGFPAVRVRVIDGAICSIYTSSNVLGPMVDERLELLAASKKISYLIKAIEKINATDNCLLPSVLWNTHTQSIIPTIWMSQPSADINAYNVSLTSNMVRKLVCKELSDAPQSFSSEESSVMQKEFHEVQKRRARFESIKQDNLTRLTGNKFLIFYSSDQRADSQIILGGMRFDPAELEAYSEKTYIQRELFLDYPSVPKITEPFARYKSIDQIPDHLKDVVLATLRMSKLNRSCDNSNYSPSSTTLLPAFVRPQASTLWFKDSASVANLSAPNRYALFVFPDMRQEK